MSSPESAISATYASYLIDLVARWNISREDLLDGLGLSMETITDPAAFLDIAEVEKLVARARKLTGEEGLPIYLGLQIPVSAHGYLGFAAMTAKNVREAIELAVQYAPIRTTAVGLKLEIERDEASLVIEEKIDLRSARDVIVIALLTSIAHVGQRLTGKQLRGYAEVAFPEPPYYRRLSRLVVGQMYFGRRRNRLVFHPSVLEVPFVMHDPAALRLAREQCEQELARYGAGGQLLLRVRGAILMNEGVRRLEEVAAQLHMSPRTLKRKLAACGTSYSELVDELRQTRALQLLRSERLSMDEIAARLGYSDAANFARAFRRWTGTTPGTFRNTSHAAK